MSGHPGSLLAASGVYVHIFCADLGWEAALSRPWIVYLRDAMRDATARRRSGGPDASRRQVGTGDAIGVSPVSLPPRNTDDRRRQSRRRPMPAAVVGLRLPGLAANLTAGIPY
jgi:hypothetical protein